MNPREIRTPVELVVWERPRKRANKCLISSVLVPLGRVYRKRIPQVTLTQETAYPFQWSPAKPMDELSLMKSLRFIP